MGDNGGGRVRVGMVGTGFVGQRRAEALAAMAQGRLVAVAGHGAAETEAFAEQYGAIALPDWSALVAHPDLDLVVVCHINSGHGAVVRAALEADRHVVVEYPLALDLAEARSLVALAQQRQRLLHVEHIELLGGSHRALKAHLGAVGQPFYARYCTLSPQRPAPRSWTYNANHFGFPLVGALSRLRRLIDCFGPVSRVYCQNLYDGEGADGSYRTCLCTAQLTFVSGVNAEVVYGKGEGMWAARRQCEVLGSEGGLYLEDDGGRLVNAGGDRPLEVGSRRGLFAADTAQVIDHLVSGQALYSRVEDSVYALAVAIAAQQSAATGRAVEVPLPEALR